MIVNKQKLEELRVAFSAAYKGGLGKAPSQWKQIATRVPSTARENRYGWLGKFPRMREWLGDRVINGMMEHDYSIVNKQFELTIGVSVPDIKDDNLGIYLPMFEEMGQAAGEHPDELVFDLLKAGFSSNCYDGQYFFDTDHPVLDENGVEQSVANTDGGSGTNWFLLCTNRSIKPIIYQDREPANFVSKDQATDDNVFNKNEALYGIDARDNVGYGFWQMAWGSKQTLDATHYATARAALSGMKGDHGRPLGMNPNLLVVPPALESAGLKLLNSEYATGGATNEWKGTAELMVCPWLA